jgi:hypothetical protein
MENAAAGKEIVCSQSGASEIKSGRKANRKKFQRREVGGGSRRGEAGEEPMKQYVPFLLLA